MAVARTTAEGNRARHLDAIKRVEAIRVSLRWSSRLARFDDQVLACAVAAQALTLAIGKNSFSGCSESSRNPYLT